MKVLLLLYRGNPYCGGQGIYLFNLGRELVKLGVEVEVIVGPPYPEPMGSFSTVYKMENMNIWSIKTKDIPYEKLIRILSPWNFIDFILTRLHVFPEMETFSMRAFFFLHKLLKKKSYDLIHDINTLGWGNIPIKGFGIPVISTVHHPLTRDMNADLMLDKTLRDKLTTILFYPLNMQKFVIKRIDHVITSFQGGVKELNEAYGLKEEKISVVYNGMDINIFKNRGENREENSLLFVGNTEDHKKGLIYLLEAMTMLPERITLTIVDHGPPRKLTAAKLIKKFNLQKRVLFTGKVETRELARLYSTKTILVMPSLYEGFGLPAVEAMACKTPVITTDAGALKEVVDEQCGIIIPAGDPKAIRDAALRLIGNKELQRKMGEKGRLKAENFSWESAAKNTLNVYRKIIKRYETG